MQHDVKSKPVASVPEPSPAAPQPPELPERQLLGSPDAAPRPDWALPSTAEKDRTATRQLRRVWVLIAGTSIIVFAIVIAPLPGPGFTIFAPIGFAMLASEFMWAKRLVNQLEHRTGFIERAAAYFVRTRNWWFLPIAIAIYWGLVFWLNAEKVLNPKYLFPIAGALFAPVGYLAWRTIVHWWNARKAAKDLPEAAGRG
ncbi:MAG: hypothetical protein J0L61_01670 [Planctomycetes bacterium]|nr:hypothetical protein [Planctomycetota bacterium]